MIIDYATVVNAIKISRREVSAAHLDRIGFGLKCSRLQSAEGRSIEFF
jgi:hypothetical protein